MGIALELNPDLALRNIKEYEEGRRELEECIPKDFEEGKIYSFLKKGQRNYWLLGEIPLLETKGGEQLSRPKAAIVIVEATHFLKNGVVYTKGKYKLVEIFRDNKIYFESYFRVGKWK